MTPPVFVLIALLVGCHARSLEVPHWKHNLDSKTMLSSNFIGESTNELATAMLQQSFEEDGNYVFSPIGYTTILAMLAEGARGETRNQLASALHFPEDTIAVRSAYKALLSRMEAKGPNKPEFKNWFYVYKNYSIEVEYMEVLAQYYRTQVKAVEWDYYENMNQEGDLLEAEKKKQEDLKKPVAEEPKPEEAKPEVAAQVNEVKVVNDKPEEEKDKVMDAPTQNVPETPEVNKVAEEKPVEKPAATDKEQASDKNKVVPDVKDKTEEKTGEKPVKEGVETAEVNKVETEEKAPKKHHARYYINKDTVTSLTANRLTRKSDGDSKEAASKKIIIFNGFYYQGNWSVPFRKCEEEKYFYTTKEEKKPVKMMQASGEFETGQVPDLAATAIEIPYKGEKYSLLVVIPDEVDGLKAVSAKLAGYNLAKIDQFLKKKQLEVSLPLANFYTISKPRPSLVNAGVKDLFSKEADLTGINGDKDLYLDELVQLVTLHFEESNTAVNFLTSSLALTRNNVDSLTADRPFFFFVRDRADGVILAAGKLQDPSKCSESKRV